MNSKPPSLTSANVSFFDAHPAPDDCHKEILAGLQAEPKTLDPKWFYDAEGSALFEQITALPEYYPTRTEVSILKAQRDSIAAYCGQGSVLIEPGAGSCAKVRLLLDAIKPSAFVPLDISADFLFSAAQDVAAAYPWLSVSALCADFRDFSSFEAHLPAGRRVLFYPGSTIGNLESGLERPLRLEVGEADVPYATFHGWCAASIAKLFKGGVEVESFMLHQDVVDSLAMVLKELLVDRWPIDGFNDLPHRVTRPRDGVLEAVFDWFSPNSHIR